MSYGFFVDVKDGVATIDTVGYVKPPDGRYGVNGHVPSPDGSDWQYESLTVTRYDQGGNQMSQASATFKK